MKRTHTKVIALAVIIVFLPFVFALMRDVDSDRGLIWFLFHQLYYLPLGSWLGEPFFKPDSEVVFWVKIPGRILMPLIYIGLFVSIKYIKSRIK